MSAAKQRPRRRKKIAEVQARRLDTGAAAVCVGRVAFWVTRAVHHGALREDVQVWLTRPDRVEVSGDVHWIGTREDGMSSLADTWSLERCAKEIGTTPADARQCLVSAPPRTQVAA